MAGDLATNEPEWQRDDDTPHPALVVATIVLGGFLLWRSLVIPIWNWLVAL